VYFVVTPATGDLQRIEQAEGESAELTLARAIAAAEPEDVVAVLEKGLLACVWTARADS